MTDAPTLELVPGARARLDRAQAWLAKQLDAGAGEVWLVAPSQRAARRLSRELAAARGRLVGLRAFTLAGLAEELAWPGLAADGLAPLPPLGARALAASTLARHAGSLPSLGTQVRAHEGLRQLLAQALAELRAHAVLPAELRGRQGAPGASGREGELATLLEAYEQALADGGHADAADLWTLAAERLDGDSPPPRRPLLLLDPAPAAAPEAELLAALARWGQPALALGAPDTPGLTRLEAAGLSGHVAARAASDALTRAQVRLWAPPSATPEEPDDTLAVRSEPEAAAEVAEVARQILGLARGGVAFDQVAVLLPSPQAYLALVQEAFARAGLPAFLVPGPPVPEPAGRTLRTLLRVGLEGGSVRRFLEALSLGQLAALTRDPEGHALSTAQLEGLLVEASIVEGDAARWDARLAGVEATRRAAHAEALRLDPDGGHAHRLAAELAGLRALRDRTAPLVGRLLGLARGQRGWAAWSHALLELARAELIDPVPVEARLTELGQLEGLGLVDLPGVLDLLDRDLGLTHDPPGGDAAGRVAVLPLAAARGCSFPHVFVPGWVEGAFPSPVHEDPLLFDATREALRGPSLRARERDRLHERDLLRIAVDAAGARLTLTFPRLEPSEGREPVPSSYLFDVLQAAEGWRGGLEALRERALDPAGARLDHPVPLDPDRAAAPVEFDLAAALTHRGLTHLFGVDEPGIATLGRALARQARLDEPGLTPADGLVDPPRDLAQAIATRSPAHTPISATGLESFAACPYAFFLSRVVRLRELEEPEPLPELDPLTRGNLIHHTVHRFLLRQGLPLQLRSARLDALVPALDAVFDETVERLREEHAVASSLLLDGELAETRRSLRRWLRARAAEGDEGWRIVASELAFGFVPEEADPRSRPDPVALPGDPPTILRGQIDLVEEHALGERRITDLKGGRQRVQDDDRLLGGQSLQRPLYALAYAQLHGQAARPTRARLSYLWGQPADVEVVVDEELVRHTQRALGYVHRAFATALFPATPAPALDAWREVKRKLPHTDAPPTCPSHCAYRPVCGRGAASRAKRKEQHDHARTRTVRSIRRQP